MKIGQLNTISAYSFTGSIIDIESYVKNAKAKGYSYVGINDINIFAYPKLAKYCLNENINPVYLYSININDNNQNIKASLLVLNDTGYKNICNIINTENKNNLTIDLLEKYKKGLAIIIETDLNFEYKLYQDILSKSLSKIRKIFDEYFFLGIGIYTSIDLENIKEIISFANTCSYKIIPFPKVMYLEKKDAYYQDIFYKSLNKNELNTSQDNSFVTTGPYFLLNEKGLKTLYNEQFLIEEEKLLNKIDFNFFEKKGELITFEDADNKLKEKALLGLKNKNLLDKKYKERLEYELKIIKDMNFSSYFLLVEDYVSFAKNNNIKVGPSRGSAGGSLVCYLLDITSLDPIKFNLSFERFLNPKRVTMPDIDIDFDSERRDEVISYLYNKYQSHSNQVSNIIVFSCLKPRSAIKFVSSTLGYKDNNIAPLLNTISTTASDFNKVRNDSYLGKKFIEIEKEKTYAKLLDVANKILNLPINTSIHASGIIVANNSISSCCEIIKKDDNTKICGFEYEAMEKLGFLKLDILSLINLTFIKNIEQAIIKNKKELKDPFKDLEIKEVYDTLNKKLLYNIFQLDNSEIVKKDIDLINPDSFKDLCELIDLIRPGAKDYVSTFARRKKKKEDITYLDYRLEPILKETYGIMLYQEQIMEVVKTIASFSLSEADLLRRAISKKSKDQINKYYSLFIQGAKKNNISDEIANKIYKDIEKFSNYGFNKAHSYGYGLLTYQLLFYKTFYSEEFYQVTLKDIRLGSLDFNKIQDELKILGYEFKNPDINKSLKEEYVFDNKQIIIPLRFNNININFIDSILEERKKGKYTSFVSFLIRNKSLFEKEENIRSLKTLVYAGAFDNLTKRREEIISKLKIYLDTIKFYSDEKEIEDFLKIKLEEKEINIGERLVNEKETLGLILSSNILNNDDNNYYTCIVKDNYDINNNLLDIITSNNEYRVKLPKKMDINNFSFITIKCDFNSKFSIKYINDIKDIKEIKEKV